MDINSIIDWIILNFRKNDIITNNLNEYNIMTIVDNHFIMDIDEFKTISIFIKKYVNLIYEKYNNKK